ncbi:uncharacterized protein [Coffea arabica]|uniref:Large ribosomal subunit protein uL29m n=2 Tax=Coffea TaxID=13442 RepID=A0A6P6SLZ9_COFAR|nr:uncharacterized protein LOC113692639 [Coffea arabica]XP_027066902.1 uncharacterized protein LOC113692639 [Coffea arabica]XP_027066904.1 uncharacterized protein LOC113692639 [Coffea arabica]XP_027066905.1 uncharacterized protein LOC113692639 [Coffea arabica]
MSAIRAIGRALFAAVKADTSSSSSAAAAAASTARTKHNPLEDFFEADRSSDDDKPVVYGRGWKASELCLKSWDDPQKLWFVLLKEKNMLMTQRQMLHAQNLRFANPEHISKVSVYPFVYQRRMHHTSDFSTIDDHKELFVYPPHDRNNTLSEDQIPLEKIKELYSPLIHEYESRSKVAKKKEVTWMDFSRLLINTEVEKRIWIFEEVHRRNLHIVDGCFSEDPPIACTWPLPNERCAIVSVIAGFDPKTGTIFYGIVIRNEHGEILLIQCLTEVIESWKRFNPHEAEAEAIRRGIKFADKNKKMLGYDKFIVESDSKEGINRVSRWASENYPNFELRHTYRELMGLTQLLINHVKVSPDVQNPDYESIEKDLKPIAEGFKAGMLRLIFPKSRKSKKGRNQKNKREN